MAEAFKAGDVIVRVGRDVDALGVRRFCSYRVEHVDEANTAGCPIVIPPAVDPRQLAAEINATVAEFNRLANLAGQVSVSVIAKIQTQAMPDQPVPRPILAVQVVALL